MRRNTPLRLCSCGAWEPVSTTCVRDAQREEHFASHAKPENVCEDAGYISPEGDYCERLTGHEGDHGAFECRLCWSERDDIPVTWSPEEGHDE